MTNTLPLLKSRYLASWCSGFDEDREPQYLNAECGTKKGAVIIAIARSKSCGCAEWIGVTHQRHDSGYWQTVSRFVGDWSGLTEQTL
jgi:hypothetical protein